MKKRQGNIDIDKLTRLIETLRGPKGCPWDQKQTPRSMGAYLLEEAYELVEAIETGAPSRCVCEELGDVLFLILFIARLFQEMGHFGIGDAVTAAHEKMVRRHPHVFGDEKVTTADEVKKNWHIIKQKERSETRHASVLDTVSNRLPALMRAYRISECAARTGFDWEDMCGVMEKVEEEWSEFKSELKEEAAAENRPYRASMEFGDVLFTMVNVARFAGIHPETALTGSIKKFQTRFNYMEKVVLETGKGLESVLQDEKQRIWEEAKKKNSI